MNGETSEILTYTAMPENVVEKLQPFDWYKQLVLKGMMYHGFEKEYIANTENIVIHQDSSVERNKSNNVILSEMWS